MTHDRLVDLATKLHESTRLSVSEALEFARLIGQKDPELEEIAFRLVRQTHSLEDAERFSVPSKKRQLGLIERICRTLAPI